MGEYASYVDAVALALYSISNNETGPVLYQGGERVDERLEHEGTLRGGGIPGVLVVRALLLISLPRNSTTSLLFPTS